MNKNTTRTLGGPVTTIRALTEKFGERGKILGRQIAQDARSKVDPMSDYPRSNRTLEIPTAMSPSILDDVVFRGAREMLAFALEAEVDAFRDRHVDLRDKRGRRRIVRNGYMPERTVLTGAGAVDVEQPRVRDRDGTIAFTSAILPPYLRRSKTVNDLIPWLYLKGISTGDMSEALGAIVGEDAAGLSASVVVRLKESWEAECDAWARRDLSSAKYAYIWADGVYFNIRLDGDEKQCILVLIGATEDGRKELIAVRDGRRESEDSWKEMFVDLKSRGFAFAPKLAVGDGGLGFWAALRKEFPETREQRCWVHKTMNVLDKMPRAIQERAKAGLHEIWMAETHVGAMKAFDTFVEMYGAKYPKAVECLAKDRDVLLTFYHFPAEHWIHIRTTNPIESTFATVRLRHRRTKGNGSRKACLAMVFKLCEAASKGWRRLNQPERIAALIEGRTFVDGIMQVAA
jgi:transposase-like protein